MANETGLFLFNELFARYVYPVGCFPADIVSFCQCTAFLTLAASAYDIFRSFFGVAVNFANLALSSTSIHRSFRRGATTRAKEMKLSDKLVDMNNRWRKVQEKSGGLPSLPMSELYVEVSQALGSKVAFSEIL